MSVQDVNTTQKTYLLWAQRDNGPGCSYPSSKRSLEVAIRQWGYTSDWICQIDGRSLDVRACLRCQLKGRTPSDSMTGRLVLVWVPFHREKWLRPRLMQVSDRKQGRGQASTHLDFVSFWIWWTAKDASGSCCLSGVRECRLYGHCRNLYNDHRDEKRPRNSIALRTDEVRTAI